MKTKLIIFLIIVAGVAMAAWALMGNKKTVKVSSVPVFKVETRDFQRIVHEVGELKALKSTIVNAPVSGKITKLVKEGTLVEAGDAIIWFDTEDIEKRIEELLLEVEISEANLERTLVDIKLRKRLAELSIEGNKKDLAYNRAKLASATEEYARKGRLVEAGLIAAKDLESMWLQVISSELTLEKSQINLEKAIDTYDSNQMIWDNDRVNSEANLERQQTRLTSEEETLEKCVIKAPDPGMVVYSKIWKGGGMEKIQAGDQVWNRAKLAEIPDMSHMQAVVQVVEMDSAMVHMDQLARVYVDACPDLVIDASVTHKSTLAQDKGADQKSFYNNQETSGIRVFEIRVAFETTDSRLRQGMTAKVEIIIKDEKGALLVPLEAVWGVDDKSYVTMEDGKEVEVELGDFNENYVIVTKGLEPDDLIALVHNKPSFKPVVKMRAVAGAVEAATGEEDVVEKTKGNPHGKGKPTS